MMNDEQRKCDEQKPKCDLRVRTKQFALRILRLYAALKKQGVEGQTIGRQLLRSGTSVGANYREATRARSAAEFVSKVETALQELEETIYWIELLSDGGIIPAARLSKLNDEAQELMAILVCSAKTAKQKIRTKKKKTIE